MAPLFRDGEWVEVANARWLWPGDVIVTESPKSHQIHRFLGYRLSRQGWVALTQADDASRPDTAHALERVLGRASVDVTVHDRVRAVGRYVTALGARLRSAWN